MSDPTPAGSEPNFIVLQVANTVDQAKLLRALLEGAGIPAYVDGSMLVDEFAISQRTMNQQGVRIMVRSDLADQAREVLEKADISDEELERQALAAGNNEPSAAGSAAGGSGRSGPMAVVFGLLAFVFLGLWMGARAEVPPPSPLYRAAPPEEAGQSLNLWRGNDLPALIVTDKDGDSVYEIIQQFNHDGQPTSTALDTDENGLYEVIIEHRASGTKVTWTDEDGDGRQDRAIVTDKNGRQIQTLVWTADRGYVPADQ